MSTELELTHTGDLALTGGDLSTNPAAVYLAAKQSARSRYTLAGDLGKLACMLTGEELHGNAELLGAALRYPWHTLRFAHVMAIRAQLPLPKSDGGKGYSTATANRLLSALRGVVGAAYDLGLIAADDYQRIQRIKGYKVQTLPAGRALTSGELHALMQACADDATAAGARDGALVALGYSCGLRRAELVKLDLADYDPQTGAVTVQGKGNKPRLVYVQNGAADALADWLAIRGDEPGALFCPVDQNGVVTVRRLTSQAYYNAMRKVGERAGVKRFSPHDLRRTFASDLLDAGADIATVAKLMGHASVTTTQRYDRRPEAAKLAATQLLHVPYRRRRG